MIPRRKYPVVDSEGGVQTFTDDVRIVGEIDRKYTLKFQRWDGEYAIYGGWNPLLSLPRREYEALEEPEEVTVTPLKKGGIKVKKQPWIYKT